MKRVLCLLLALVLAVSLAAPAFADDDFMVCRICGKHIPADSNFCPYCGEAVVLVEGGATPRTDTPADPGPFKNFNHATGRLRVTKSPTSESVPYGGGCLFIAHADNASSITWYLANADATLICEAGSAPATVSGLYVSGEKTDTLHLSGIPSWMNGFQVQAVFTGEDGKVYTDVARIWTYEEPAPKKECWSYWDMIAFCYANPWAWDVLFPGMIQHGPDVDNAVTDPETGLSVAPDDPRIGHGPNAIAIHVGHTVNTEDEEAAQATETTGDQQPGAAPEGFNPGGQQPGAAPEGFNPGGQQPGAAPEGFNPGGNAVETQAEAAPAPESGSTGEAAAASAPVFENAFAFDADPAPDSAAE